MRNAAILCQALLLLGPVSGLAQFTSVVEGRVTDPSDAAVPNAEVTVENASTGNKRVVRTSEIGYYRIASLPPGEFTIRIAAPGFETSVLDRVLLQNDQTKTLNLTMKVGAPSTTVNVTAEVPLVETGATSVSRGPQAHTQHAGHRMSWARGRRTRRS